LNILIAILLFLLLLLFCESNLSTRKMEVVCESVELFLEPILNVLRLKKELLALKRKSCH
jgi:hypothetical protein